MASPSMQRARPMILTQPLPPFLMGPLNTFSTDAQGPTDSINRTSRTIWWAHTMPSASMPKARPMVSTKPHPPFLMGPLDTLSTDAQGPTDCIDQTSCTIWWAHTMPSASMPKARPMVLTKPHPPFLTGPHDALSTDVKGPTDGVDQTPLTL